MQQLRFNSPQWLYSTCFGRQSHPSSGWWVRLSPETCRVKPLRRIKRNCCILLDLFHYFIMEWGSSTSVEKHNRHIRNLSKFWELQSLMKNNDHMNDGSTNVSKSKSHLKIPGARRVTSVYGRPGARHMNSSILRQKKLKSRIPPLKHSVLSREKSYPGYRRSK